MPKITDMYCFAMYDKDENDEGVPAFSGPLGPMPLVGADLTRIESLMPIAQDLANQFGKPLRIYTFSERKQIGEVSPQTECKDREEKGR